MLLGEHRHTLDAKKRLSLPSKFRTELGKKVVVTKGFDGSLLVYSIKEWKKLVEKLQNLSLGQSDARAFSRHLFGGASEVEIDKSGRILIPDFLKDYADLKQTVMVVGLSHKVELWSEERWAKYQNALQEKSDIIAEKLGGIGMI